MGLNRLKHLPAGLFGMVLLRDGAEDAAQTFPSGKYEVPLLIYDPSATPTVSFLTGLWRPRNTSWVEFGGSASSSTA